MRVLDRMCAEIVAYDSQSLFNDSMFCVLEAGRGIRRKIGPVASGRKAFRFFGLGSHDVTNSHARSTISIPASIIYACQSLMLLMTIVIHCPPSVNLVLPMTFVTNTVHQPTFAPNNAPVPSLQGTLNPYL